MDSDVKEKIIELRRKGYTTEEIANLLNLHPDTVEYILASYGVSERKREEKEHKKEAPARFDVYLDRSVVARRPAILDKVAEGASIYLRELIDEGVLEEPEVIVGFNPDGFAVALAVAKAMMKPVGYIDMRLSSASIDPLFSDIVDKKVLLIDDVVSSGEVVGRIISVIRNVGAIPIGVFVLVNKSGKNDISGVPLFSLFELRILRHD